MNHKIAKILLKSLWLFPFYFLLIFIAKSNYNLGIPLIIIIAFIVSVISILSNLFDYDYYNDMDPSDYLESTHKSSIPFTEAVWKRILELESENLFTCVGGYHDENSITYIIKRKSINSEIKFTHANQEIRIDISRKVIKMIPDKSSNYKTLRKVLFKLNENPT